MSVSQLRSSANSSRYIAIEGPIGVERRRAVDRRADPFDEVAGTAPALGGLLADNRIALRQRRGRKRDKDESEHDDGQQPAGMNGVMIHLMDYLIAHLPLPSAYEWMTS